MKQKVINFPLMKFTEMSGEMITKQMLAHSQRILSVYCTAGAMLAWMMRVWGLANAESHSQGGLMYRPAQLGLDGIHSKENVHVEKVLFIYDSKID